MDRGCAAFCGAAYGSREGRLDARWHSGRFRAPAAPAPRCGAGRGAGPRPAERCLRREGGALRDPARQRRHPPPGQRAQGRGLLPSRASDPVPHDGGPARRQSTGRPDDAGGTPAVLRAARGRRGCRGIGGDRRLRGDTRQCRPLRPHRAGQVDQAQPDQRGLGDRRISVTTRPSPRIGCSMRPRAGSSPSAPRRPRARSARSRPACTMRSITSTS